MLSLISIAAVLAAVGVHYEAIALATFAGRPFHQSHRMRVAVAVLVIVVAHLVEVMVFAAGWAVLLVAGTELSIPSPNFADLVYFSGSVYTSLGFGDIVPTGLSRLYAVVEAVTGLVLIAWTASYTFLQMQTNWRVE